MLNILAKIKLARFSLSVLHGFKVLINSISCGSVNYGVFFSVKIVYVFITILEQSGL